jgi:hypothetical protein
MTAQQARRRAISTVFLIDKILKKEQVIERGDVVVVYDSPENDAKPYPEEQFIINSVGRVMLSGNSSETRAGPDREGEGGDRGHSDASMQHVPTAMAENTRQVVVERPKRSTRQ